VFDRRKGNTNNMDEKDETWQNNHLPDFEAELAARVEAES
jgi:hypothetical protein